MYAVYTIGVPKGTPIFCAIQPANVCCELVVSVAADREDSFPVRHNPMNPSQHPLFSAAIRPEHSETKICLCKHDSRLPAHRKKRLVFSSRSHDLIPLSIC